MILNTQQFIDKLRRRTEQTVRVANEVMIDGGNAICKEMKQSVPIDSGRLKLSIHQVTTPAFVNPIVTEVYADALATDQFTQQQHLYWYYVEYGTGIHVPGGRQTPWKYKDENGDWHTTTGQEAQPFVGPSVTVVLPKMKRFFQVRMAWEVHTI